MKERADGWRETSVLVEQIIVFVDVMASGGKQAISKAAAIDMEKLMGISAMLVAAFEAMNEIEEKDKVAVAFMKIISAQKEREK